MQREGAVLASDSKKLLTDQVILLPSLLFLYNLNSLLSYLAFAFCELPVLFFPSKLQYENMRV